MLDILTYISSTGKRIDFGEGGSNIIINTNDLRDYEWTYSQSGRHFFTFKREAVTRTIPVLIYGENVKEIADDIFETIEYDLINKKYGKLYSSDYYVKGYFIGSTKTNYTADGFLQFNLLFASDEPFWVREKFYAYRPTTHTDETILYDGNTPYVVNSSFIEQNMRIVFYGAWASPLTIDIGDNTYQLDTSLSANETAIINTAEKTIVKVNTSTGIETNIFNTRDKSNYIFQKIPSGKQVISTTPANKNVDITIYEERSEPRWL